MFDLPNTLGGSAGAISLGDLFGKALGGRSRTMRTLVKDAYEPLLSEESEKLLDQDQIIQEAMRDVESNGIVFLDEIDKICTGNNRGSGEISREGVQRDLLPLIEGTSVSTKYGSIKTDHILFIASGAFHVSKPSDLLPELQGRLPIRVELRSLSEEDFKRILVETEASLIKQYVALLQTEGVTLTFRADAIEALARIAVEVNMTIENIGARRLQTIMEKLLEDVSFTAPDRSGQEIVIDRSFVESQIADLARNADLSRFVL
jgi:ATP-dependent HslUV protease ATP-binding subunit HslU